MTDPLAGFDTYARAVRKRLEAGRESYRDESFRKSPAELLAEVSEELLDVAGWAYVAWCRVQAIALEADEAARKLRAGRAS